MKASAGTQIATGNRWGDYSTMTVDPFDGCTFWYTREYLPGEGQFNWKTRIGTFRYSSCTAPAQGVINGVVTDCVTGAPVSNALVSVSNGFSGATDANGRYSIIVPPGSYTVSASAPLRLCAPSASQSVTVAANGTASRNFCLTGSPKLTFASSTIDDSAASNNGAVNRDECVKLAVSVANVGCAVATGVNATLATSTPGVTVNQPKATLRHDRARRLESVRGVRSPSPPPRPTDSAAASRSTSPSPSPPTRAARRPRSAFRPAPPPRSRRAARSPPTMRSRPRASAATASPAPALRESVSRGARHRQPLLRSVHVHERVGCHRMRDGQRQCRRVVQRHQSDPRLGVPRQLRSAEPLRELPRPMPARVRTPASTPSRSKFPPATTSSSSSAASTKAASAPATRSTFPASSTTPPPAAARARSPPTVNCLEDNDPQIGYANGWHLINDTKASGGHFRMQSGKTSGTSVSLGFSVPAGSERRDHLQLREERVRAVRPER